MLKKQTGERQNTAWLWASAAVPVVHGAATCSWLVTLTIGAGCFFLTYFVRQIGTKPGKWFVWPERIWAGVVISQILLWIGQYWPKLGSGITEALILLALAGWAAAKGKERMVRTACVVLWPLTLLIGIVLLSGISEINAQSLRPSWEQRDGWLIVAALLPALNGEKTKKKGIPPLIGLVALGIGTSVIVKGVLGNVKAEAPMYELSRSLSLLGVGERFESLVAAGMTMGIFAAAGYILSWNQKEEKKDRGVWLAIGIAAVIILMQMEIDSRWIAIGSIMLWVIIPLASGLKRNLKKTKKTY